MTKKIILAFNIGENIFWHSFGFLIAVFYLGYRFFIPKKPGSHPLSRLGRLIFEDKKARLNWGTLLLVTILALNFVLPSTFSWPSPQTVLAAPENIITTESTFQFPVKGVLSQGYHWYHQAIDLASPLGEEIYPLGPGKVIQVEFQKWGLGHFVVIDHLQGYQSVYAHLQDIKVQVGSQINKETCLGTIGLTGFTTGPHLHLEVLENSKLINPSDVLPQFSAQD